MLKSLNNLFIIWLIGIKSNFNGKWVSKFVDKMTNREAKGERGERERERKYKQTERHMTDRKKWTARTKENNIDRH